MSFDGLVVVCIQAEETHVHTYFGAATGASTLRFSTP
jgi:hypothetical protein